MKINTKLILKIAVSTFFIIYIVNGISFTDVRNQLYAFNLIYIPLIFLLLVLNYVFSSIRWKALLFKSEYSDLSLMFFIKLYFIGAFFNNFLPTSVGGDVYKIYRLGKRINNTVDAFSSTFMERFTGVLALLIISSLGLIKLLGVWGILILFSVVVGIPIGYILLQYLSKKTGIKKISEIYLSISSYICNWKVLLFAFFTSFIVQIIAIFTQYFIFSALGFNMSISYALFAFPVITLASFFLPSMNGIGVQDSLYASMFSVIGISTTVSLSASVLYHVSRLLISLVGGLFYAFDKDN